MSSDACIQPSDEIYEVVQRGHEQHARLNQIYLTMAVVVRPYQSESWPGCSESVRDNITRLKEPLTH